MKNTNVVSPIVSIVITVCMLSLSAVDEVDVDTSGHVCVYHCYIYLCMCVESGLVQPWCNIL